MQCLALWLIKNTNVVLLKDKKIEWSSDKAKALGITFHTNHELFIKENIDKKIEEFNNVLKQWQHRKISILGRITVIKSLALLKLIYPLTVLQKPSPEQIKQLTNSMFKFIWNSKPDKIKRKQLIQNYQNGGLRMLDIDLFINSIKCSWIKRLFDNKNNGQWKIFYTNKINKYGGKLLFESSLNKENIINMFPKCTFLQEILLASLNVLNNDKDITYVGKQILRNNKKYSNK